MGHKLNIRCYEDFVALNERVRKYFVNGGDEFNLEWSKGEKRSIPQNKYYWGVVVKIATDYYTKNPACDRDWETKSS